MLSCMGFACMGMELRRMRANGWKIREKCLCFVRGRAKRADAGGGLPGDRDAAAHRAGQVPGAVGATGVKPPRVDSPGGNAACQGHLNALDRTLLE